MSDIRPFVQAYLDAGFDPVPLEPGSKVIRLEDWNLPETHFTLDDFQATSNVGARLGVPGTAPDHKILHDADLDDPKAALIADILLPATGAMFGHASKPLSHYFYVCDEAIPYVKYDGFGGTDDTLVELRGVTKDGKATQTAIPPSVWTNKNNPAPYGTR